MVEVAFYGDDFTGSTDALVQFARVGLRSVLLVTLPSASELRELSEQYDVIGVAGVARSLPPDEQETELRPILEALWGLRPRLIQYKVCSTADSSPTRGSIGRALELGREVCGPTPVPILIAQPELGRYTIFSHHFATESGTTHRLDRQPTMSTHPSTPMQESDLCRHLSAQTALPITSLHRTDYKNLPDAYTTVTSGPAAIVLDALDDGDLQLLGKAIAEQEAGFAVGSGGLSRAVGLALRPAGAAVGAAGVAVGGPVLVVSGSQSPRTAEQVEHARSAGWTVLPLTYDAPERAVAAFVAGADGVVVHTNNLTPEGLRGAPAALADVIRAVTANTVTANTVTPNPVTANAVPPNTVGPNTLSPSTIAAGTVTPDAIAAGGVVRRVVVAGGDTSGQVLRELEVSALEFTRSLAPGVHLCRATSPHFDEVVLKPGQLGPIDLFTAFQRRSV